MRYQGEISGMGEHTFIPIEAETREGALAQLHDAAASFPKLLRKYVGVRPLADGEEAKDDRATLQFAPPRMGRPSQGRSIRLQATITPDLQAWLDSQRRSGESLSDVIFRLLSEIRAARS